MKRLLTMGTGLLLLITAIFGTGCAPMPYQEPYYFETEVIVVYEPIPDPGPICKNPPPLPPDRHTPLTAESNSGNPRIKTPRTGRGDDRITSPRVREGKQSLAQQAGHKATKRTGPKRR
jgi:hypothetical protein